jgi:peptide/nickel transport system permease protein
MKRFILVRLAQAILTALVLATLVFVLVRVSGSPITWLVSPHAPAATRELVIKHYGLDQPMIVQYGHFLLSISHGDFGVSYFYSRPVTEIISTRVPATLELAGTALLIAIIVALPIGVYSAVKRGRAVDIAGRIFAFLGISAPSFWVGLMGIYLFSVRLHVLPAGGRRGIASLILPALVLSWGLAAGMARLTRSGMLSVLGSDYITMARAKGVPEQTINWKHAFRNASIPVVTMAMLLMIVVLSGDVVIENIFSWPGIGRLIMTSVLARDYPVVQALTILISFVFVVISLLADVLYAYLNPKIRYQRTR